MLGMTKKCLEDRATSPCFGFRQNIPLLLQGEGPEGEVCCPHPVMLSAAKHPCCGFLTGVRNDKKVFGNDRKEQSE
jgi:hypothetical protein